LTESVETLECIMNEKTLPISLKEIVAKRDVLEVLRNKAKISKLKTSL
jgi:hypothetical protein